MARIFFVSSIQFNLHFRLGLMETLVKENHLVAAAAAFDGGEELLRERGIRCLPLTHIQRGGLNPWAEIGCLYELGKLYQRERPELILHYTIKPNIYGSLAAAWAGIPAISTITGAGYAFMQRGLVNLLVRGLYKTALRFPAKVFFQNPDDRDLFIRTGLVPPAKAITVPGSGVNLDHYAPKNWAGNKKADDGKIRFLFIGRLLWDKGIGEFVEAAGLVCRSFPLTEFQVLGRVDPGNPAAVPEDLFQGWVTKESIRYLGWVKDVRPIISQADVVVLPSYREGIPRSLLEAMAMAKPIITTDSVGCREVVEDGKNGFMVPVRDAAALAEAMKKMIALGEEAQREMGRYGRQKAEREFDERIVIQKYVEEIEKLLADQGKA